MESWFRASATTWKGISTSRKSPPSPASSRHICFLLVRRMTDILCFVVNTYSVSSYAVHSGPGCCAFYESLDCQGKLVFIARNQGHKWVSLCIDDRPLGSGCLLIICKVASVPISMMICGALCAGAAVECVEDGWAVQFKCLRSIRITCGQSASIKLINIYGGYGW